MANKIKGICIKVHPAFFSMFERKRKSYEKKFKINFSQVNTSELLTKDFFNITNPHIFTGTALKMKSNKKYYPKRFRTGRFLI